MWIVKLALRQPYTFVVMALAILILGVVAIYRTPVDIFPVVDIPVVSVIWTYSGMAPEEMTGRITTVSGRAITTTVSDIEHIESQSYNGVSVIKIYFQTGANIPEAVAEVTAIMQGVLRVLPPGITPPLVVQYSASDVLILQAVVYSDTLPEDRLNDYSNALFPFLGRDFFPSVDAGLFRLRARAPVGTRIEETALRFSRLRR
jgi:multidrug efflux pump subunit AcrB